MANDNNIKIFTAADIEKYHKGQLSTKEMHDLEKAALDDPFLADALEGYSTPGISINPDLAELKKRLAGKTEEAKVIPMHAGSRRSYPMLRVAVMIIFVLGAALLSYQLFFRSTSTKELAQAPKEKESDSANASSLNKSTQTNASTPYIMPGKDTELLAVQPLTPENPKQRKGAVEDSAVVPGNTIINNGLATTTTNESPVTTAPLKLEEYKVDDVKSLSKDNAADKNAIVVNDNFKLKESAKRKEEAEGLSMNQRAVTAKGVTNNNRSAQGYITNFFRSRVTDANNNPIPFANITNTTDNVGTYSDSKGYFTLVSPYDSVMDVQVRALGYENSRLRLRSDVNTNQVTLQEDRSIAARILDTARRNYAIRSREGNMSFEEPEPVDGWTSYDSYLANNQHDIPEAFDVKKNTGSDAVELSFEVNKNGDPVNIRVEKSLCDKCDKEAIRLVKEGPKWKRKAKKGKRTTVTVPFIKTD